MTSTEMIRADADVSVMHMNHVDDCRCRYTLVAGGETKLIDARCISGYSVPAPPPGADR